METHELIAYLVSGCVFWPCLFHLIWFVLLSKFNFSDASACGTSMRLVSVIHAVMAAFVGTVSVMNTYRDIIYDDYWLLNYFAAFAYSYMPYDTYAMYAAFIREKNLTDAPFPKRMISYLKSQKLTVFHHAISTFLGYPIILHYRHNKGTFIVGSIYITEYSTPFVNFRKILIKLGYGSTQLFKYNNFIVCITFFLVRVVLWPFMYLVYAINKEETPRQVLVSVPYGCHIAMTIVSVMQTSWFIMFFRGFVKALRSDHKLSKKHEGAVNEVNGHAGVEDKKTE